MAREPDLVEPDDVEGPAGRRRTTLRRVLATVHPRAASSDGTRLVRYMALMLGALVAAIGLAVIVVILVVLMAVGGSSALKGGTTTVTCSPDGATADAPPAALVPIYQKAAEKYRLGYQGWAILAAINRVETDFGQNLAVSDAGAVGWMQFMPDTWAKYGVDANGDGKPDPSDPEDAIHSAANYLAALLKEHGGDWRKAIFGYNHANWYVDKILAQADAYQGACNFAPSSGDVQSVVKVTASDPWLAPVPNTNARCDARIIDNVVYLLQRFKLKLGDCYAPTGHTSAGEHPLGLAVDVWPADGNWDNTMAAARSLGWSEQCAARGCPSKLARWIGYNGVPDHGDPQHCTGGCPPHLHVSWNHAPAPYNTQAAWVMVWNLSSEDSAAARAK